MDTNFRPVSRSTLSDEVAHRVAQLIKGESFAEGDRLPTISDMAGRFDVGPPTLREALKKLEALGMVRIKHGSGVYVLKQHDVLLMSNPIFVGEVSKKMMIDLIEARIPIELKSVTMAAEHATEEHFEHMQELLVDAQKHLDDDAVLNLTNLGFHQEVASASGNVVITQMLEVLTDLFKNEQRAILSIFGQRAKDHEEHLSILDALEKRDAKLAEQRMHDHLEGVREVLLQWDPDEHPIS